MKKKGDFAQEIDDLMRSFCQPEIEQCKDIPIDMDKINDGIDMGIAYWESPMPSYRLIC